MILREGETLVYWAALGVSTLTQHFFFYEKEDEIRAEMIYVFRDFPGHQAHGTQKKSNYNSLQQTPEELVNTIAKFMKVTFKEEPIRKEKDFTGWKMSEAVDWLAKNEQELLGIYKVELEKWRPET